MGRKIGAALAGLVVLGSVVLAVQWVGTLLYPLPPGIDPMDPGAREALNEHLGAMPAVGWLLPLGSELLGAFLGAWVAGRLAGGRPHALVAVVVGLALVGSVNNWLSFTHPVWFMAGQLVGYPLVYLGTVRVLGRNARDPSPAAPTG
ncbi:MAG: hypothetical protein AMXMBFR53_19150 [Gemmatimonadota bacterium]